MSRYECKNSANILCLQANVAITAFHNEFVHFFSNVSTVIGQLASTILIITNNRVSFQY